MLLGVSASCRVLVLLCSVCLSAPTDFVGSAPPEPVAPEIDGVPAIDDTTPRVGETLTVLPASATGDEPLVNTFEWFAGVSSVGTGSTLLVTSGMVGEQITVEQTTTNDVGFATATSLPTDAVVDPPAVPEDLILSMETTVDGSIVIVPILQPDIHQ